MSDEHDSDLAVELQFYREYAAALESLAGRFRLAADVLQHVGPGDRDRLRRELRGVTRRTITATTITIALLDGGPIDAMTTTPQE